MYFSLTLKSERGGYARLRYFEDLPVVSHR